MILVIFFKSIKNPKKITEGFMQNENFLFKTGKDVYDDFYSEIYDFLVFNNLKSNYETGAIISETSPSTHSRILDVGCGTGHHVAKLTASDLDVIGLDISPSMINQAKTTYPKCNFEVGDVMNGSAFPQNSFTHILCMYFTIYYFKDKDRFFENSFNWLMPGGYLVVHVVDRDNFDPILPPGNPLLIVSPQKYAKKRITKTSLKFNNFDYTANFDLKSEDDLAVFGEKFKFKDGKVRKQEHKLYMETDANIINRAEDVGFIVHSKVDLMRCAYDNQYLYIFMKPE